MTHMQQGGVYTDRHIDKQTERQRDKKHLDGKVSSQHTHSRAFGF